MMAGCWNDAAVDAAVVVTMEVGETAEASVWMTVETGCQGVVGRPARRR